jgi:iron(III) transport system substrate-binding protein
MQSKSILTGCLSFVVLFLNAVCAQAQLETLYKAAKSEGQLEIWSPTPPAEIRAITEAFTKDFPEIKVNHFEIRDSDFVPRVLVEARLRRMSFDIGQGNYMASSALIDRDLIKAHPDLPEIFPNIPPGALTKDGRFVTMYNLIFPIAYNTDLVKPEEVPTTWDQLLTRKWGEGKIMVEPRGMVFALLGLKWGKERMLDYTQKLRAQKPLFVKSGSGIIKQLAAGAATIGIGTYIHFVLQRKNTGGPVDWSKRVDLLPAISQVMYAMKGAPHPNAAKLFSGWLSTKGEIFHTSFLKGALRPGSSYSVQQEAERNKVETILESLENYKQLAILGESAAKSLGAVR